MSDEKPFEVIHISQLKDHELADFVNQLTKVANKYGNTQQLRAQISEVVHDKLRPYRNKALQGIKHVTSDPDYLTPDDPILKCTVLCKEKSC